MRATQVAYTFRETKESLVPWIGIRIGPTISSSLPRRWKNEERAWVERFRYARASSTAAHKEDADADAGADDGQVCPPQQWPAHMTRLACSLEPCAHNTCANWSEIRENDNLHRDQVMMMMITMTMMTTMAMTRAIIRCKDDRLRF